MCRKEKKRGGGDWKDENRDGPVREVVKRKELMAAAALVKLPEC